MALKFPHPLRNRIQFPSEFLYVRLVDPTMYEGNECMTTDLNNRAFSSTSRKGYVAY